MTFTNIDIEPEQLLTQREALDKLRESGSDYTALTWLTNKYFETFGSDLLWQYPLCDGENAGAFILPVREGFLYLPYNRMDVQKHELLDLDRAFLLDSDDVKTMRDEWQSYSGALAGALTDMIGILESSNE